MTFRRSDLATFFCFLLLLASPALGMTDLGEKCEGILSKILNKISTVFRRPVPKDELNQFNPFKSVQLANERAWGPRDGKASAERTRIIREWMRNPQSSSGQRYLYENKVSEMERAAQITRGTSLKLLNLEHAIMYGIRKYPYEFLQWKKLQRERITGVLVVTPWGDLEPSGELARAVHETILRSEVLSQVEKISSEDIFNLGGAPFASEAPSEAARNLAIQVLESTPVPLGSSLERLGQKTK